MGFLFLQALDEGKIKVSIIIVTNEWHNYLEECISKCKALSSENFEIIILPDLPFDREIKGVRVISTGRYSSPSTKKNIGAKEAKGEILAYIDSDAYPEANWLNNALKYFQDPDVSVVGGPNLTPETDNYLQQANGIILSSLFCSGPFAARYDIKKRSEGNELPSCNLFIRKSDLEQIGGFEKDLWPGEDAKFCFQVLDNLKKRVIYAPDVIVYHHRRPLFYEYLKQIWGYGHTKGYIITEFSSIRRIFYFIPSLFVLFLISGFFFWNFVPARIVYLTILSIYSLSCFLVAIQTKDIWIGFLVFIGIFLTHITYGIAFIFGLLARLFKR